MSRKQIIYEYKLATIDISQPQTITSTTNIEQVDAALYTLDWSGAQASNGEIVIEATADNETWFALDFGVTSIPVNGVSGDHQIFIRQHSFKKIRLTYNRTNIAATGTMNVWVRGTTLGA